MSSFNDTVLNALKQKFVHINPNVEFNTNMASSQAQFYVKNLIDNLIETMIDPHVQQYQKGSGNELDSNMCALKSSSAMTFNLLGNDSIVFKENLTIPGGRYHIEYEKQLHTLKEGRQPANLDAQLLCPENGVAVFCEMKMTEWLFNNPGVLKDKYLDPQNYIHSKSFEPFNKVFKALISDHINGANEHKSIYKRYDAFQMMKHILAIYNAVSSSEYDKFTKIILVNCVWEMSSPEILGTQFSDKYREYYYQELSEFYNFKRKLKPVISLFKGLGVDFEIIFISFDDFLKLSDKSRQQLDYLERYYI